MTETHRLTGLTIKNYKSLANVSLENLPPVVCLIGKNGSGKSAFLESLSFLGYHFYLNNRNKMDRKFQNELTQYFFDLNRPEFSKAEITYNLNGKIIAVEKEKLQDGSVITRMDRKFVVSDEFLESAKLFITNQSYFKIQLPSLTDSKDSIDTNYLTYNGANLPDVAYHIQETHPLIWESINEALKQYVPGFHKVIVIRDDYRRTFLRFYNEKHEQVLLPKEMSDGTLLILAHLLLLRHPDKYSILCIDEPEHHLYPSFLSYLAGEIQDYALQAGNVFVSTHSPELVNGFDFESIYYCKKNAENLTEIYRLSDNSYLTQLYQQGITAGAMLRNGTIDEVFK